MIPTAAAGILATALGFLSWNSTPLHNSTSREILSYNTPAISTDSWLVESDDQTLRGKGEGKKQENEDVEEGAKNETNGVYAKPAPFIFSQGFFRRFQLSREELARIGIQVNRAGIGNFYREGDAEYGFQLSPTGTLNICQVDLYREPGTAVVPFHPTIVTDDFGNRRIEFFDRVKGIEHVSATPDSSAGVELPRWRVLSEDLQAKLALYFRSQGYPVGKSDPVIVTGTFDSTLNRFQIFEIAKESMPDAVLGGTIKIEAELGSELYKEIVEKKYPYEDLDPVLYRGSMRFVLGNYFDASFPLLPILVQTEDGIAENGTGAHRPDCIFWYEVTPELLAALPERIHHFVQDRFLCAAERITVRQSFDGLQSADEGAPEAVVARVDESSATVSGAVDESLR